MNREKKDVKNKKYKLFLKLKIFWEKNTFLVFKKKNFLKWKKILVFRILEKYFFWKSDIFGKNKILSFFSPKKIKSENFNS